MIFLNKNPAGKPSNMIFGLLEILDGLVRITTFGFVCTNFLCAYSRRQVEIHLKKIKEQRL